MKIAVLILNLQSYLNISNMKKSVNLILILLSVVLFSSCTTIFVAKAPVKKDNGNHYGWYKNPKNPHNPAHNDTKIVIKEKNKVVVKDKKGNNGNKGNKKK